MQMKMFNNYIVTSTGLVYSCFYKTARLMSVTDNGCGYLSVTLSINKKSKKYYVHRLVAECYLQEWEPSLQVNHIDGNKTNNHVSNLEMCTPKQNINHAYKIGLVDWFAENNNRGKLTNADITYIRNNPDNLKGTELAIKFNVKPPTISQIRNGLRRN